MTRTALILAVAAFAAAPAHAEEKRAADAHEHGHGAFRMAIEDGNVAIEMVVPAFDVIGFEHAPSTDEQRQAIVDTSETLSRPGTVFILPEAARCVAEQIEFGYGAIEGDSHDHGDHGHEDHDHEEHDHKHDDHAEGEETHSEVTADYYFACADTDAIDKITFTYFETFPNAEELEVVVLSAAGQSAGEVSRDAAVFEIE